ncbi:diaminopimelate epimerase [Convivina praedatoris]|uniref:Diaminopimelate epimerase n=1 Tax=Convivina praedatoris TaxID=2880963 RepID=A0ABN8H8B5_9LACO|nr:diaminopimelate epimerase [Convivina sp. LMG 32447]CAH1852104.1 Diaminopimelate epimerase [Convivina sp. LMG 32447]CAH1852129.1 Diaminopimelate epimerase [Convivina sp. LMG 32447]CAH1852802.1 Diaminopimelate epimerase [Convivina sp. LMG 32447]
MAELTRVHGSENQFFILDQTSLDQALSEEELTQLALNYCQKDANWAGADGVLVIEAATHPGPIGRMIVVNADGSRASMCGNGLRCVGRYLAEKYNQTEFTVETSAADLRVSHKKDLAPEVKAFSVEISPVSYERTALPFDKLGKDEIINEYLPELSDRLLFTGLAVPNPHLISFVKDEEDLSQTLGDLGQKLNQTNPYFPDGVNVNFAKILGPNRLFVRTYERGVGFTNACGTGMSATSLAFAQNYPDLVDVRQPIEVFNPGGMVKTIVHPNGAQQWIELIGNATFTAKITLDEALLHSSQLQPDQLSITSTTEEKAYLNFVNSLNRK